VGGCVYVLVCDVCVVSDLQPWLGALEEGEQHGVGHDALEGGGLGVHVLHTEGKHRGEGRLISTKHGGSRRFDEHTQHTGGLAQMNTLFLFINSCVWPRAVP
jgi:hypothetical protein